MRATQAIYLLICLAVLAFLIWQGVPTGGLGVVIVIAIIGWGTVRRSGRLL